MNNTYWKEKFDQMIPRYSGSRGSTGPIGSVGHTGHPGMTGSYNPTWKKKFADLVPERYVGFRGDPVGATGVQGFTGSHSPYGPPPGPHIQIVTE